MHDQRLHLRVDGQGLPKVGGRLDAGEPVPFPVFVHRPVQGLVVGVDLPAHLTGHKVDHGRGGGGVDAAQDRIARALIGGEGVGVEGGDV